MKGRLSGIYRISHLDSGRSYIGSSVDIKQRWKRHEKELRNHEHHSPYLQNAWDKYGEMAFEFSVVEIVNDQELLRAREQYWLDRESPAFNVMMFAERPDVMPDWAQPNPGARQPDKWEAKLPKDSPLWWGGVIEMPGFATLSDPACEAAFVQTGRTLALKTVDSIE